VALSVRAGMIEFCYGTIDDTSTTKFIFSIIFIDGTIDDIDWSKSILFMKRLMILPGKKPLLNWELHQRSLSALEVTPAMRSSVAAIATNLYSLYEFSVMYILLHVFMGS
jgi:hypothetical protein